LNQTLSWKNMEETHKWASAFSRELTRPCLVLLSGSLGAGKTQLVKWFLEPFGAAHVVSPTFTIHQEYHTASGAVDHVDLYRLHTKAEVESCGLWDLFARDNGLIFVEWAERLADTEWPAGWKKIFIRLSVDGEGRSAQVRVEG
jgi:tRNA threonylcarbamoyladenosine biosynthesis protein TsaE